MTNAIIIRDFCSNIEKTAERIRTLSDSIDLLEQRGDAYLVTDFEEFRLNELEQLQRLTIGLSETLGISFDEDNETVNIDEGGSVFAQGDLTFDLGDKTDDKIGHIATERGTESCPKNSGA